MERLPIILVHTGKSYYLGPVVRQARWFNPENRICLLSDASTKGISGVEHVMMDGYMDSAKAFEKVYQHLSINSYQFELFCFQRWFIVRDFAKAQGFKRFVCLDSDFLLFDQVDAFFASCLDYDFTVCGKIGPIFILFNEQSIDKFCSFCTELYTRPAYLSFLQDSYKGMAERRELGGICDMTAFGLYQEHVSSNVLDIAYPRNGVCVDHRIRSSFGFEMDDAHPDMMGNTYKKIYWVDNRPFGRFLPTGEFVRFAGLHLQGGAKKMLPYFLLDAKGERHPDRFHALLWNLRPCVLKHTLRTAWQWYSNWEVLKQKVFKRKKTRNHK